MTARPPERHELATRATGLLRTFNRAGVLAVADVQVAQRVSFLAREARDDVQLALALVVRALRLGSVCVALETLRDEVLASMEEQPPDDLPWPDPAAWVAAVRTSPLVTDGADGAGVRPLRLVDGQLYLQRSWEQQEDVRAGLLARAATGVPAPDPDRLAVLARRLFDGVGLAPGEPDRAREAAELALRSRVMVLAGGPGTGKTTTIARLLALVALHEGDVPRISLAAPSGKAAARLVEAVRGEVRRMDLPDHVARRLLALEGRTLHRLLGAVPGRRVARHAGNRLPADVVVVDEVSMVSLAKMAELLAAVRPEARLVLVGDPDQLTSVDAGAVLADITAAVEGRGVAIPHVRLTHTWRYGGAIGDLADAVRHGDADETLAVLRGGDPQVGFVELTDAGGLPDGGLDLLRARAMTTADAVRAALAGDAATALRRLRAHRVLCAHRFGPHSQHDWNVRIGQWLRDEVGDYAPDRERHAGQPLLVTRNDPDLGISNGDTGIVVATAGGQLRAALDLGGAPLLLAPSLLDSVETVHAMTVHKAQGSQFDAVTVALPMLGSPLLTRELLYTAVTRAEQQVTIVAHPDAVRAAVTRPALRASGLRGRL